MRAVLPILLLTICWLIMGCGVDQNNTSTDFCDSLRRPDSIDLSQIIAPFEPLMETKTGVFVLEEGGGSLITRAWLSEYAEHSIDIQYFIFSLDNVGLIALDYIVRAADRGVKVRILVDDIMLEADPSEKMQLLTFVA